MPAGKKDRISSKDMIAQVQELTKYVERTEYLLNKKLARLGSHIKVIRQVLEDVTRHNVNM